jgi:hypothetical protein
MYPANAVTAKKRLIMSALPRDDSERKTKSIDSKTAARAATRSAKRRRKAKYQNSTAPRPQTTDNSR